MRTALSNTDATNNAERGAELGPTRRQVVVYARKHEVREK